MWRRGAWLCLLSAALCSSAVWAAAGGEPEAGQCAPSVADWLRTEQPERVELGLLMLTQHPGPAVAAAAECVLAEGPASARATALTVLRVLRGSELTDRLIALAENDADADVRRQAIDELRVLEAKTAQPAVAEALRRDPDLSVRVAAAEALGALGVGEDLQILIRASRSRHLPLRRAATLALGQSGLAGAIPAIAQRLRDRDRLVRRAGVEAAASSADHSLVPNLLKRLDDPDNLVRDDAADVLVRWAAPDMTAEVAPYLHNGQPHVRMSATRILGAIGTPGARELLRRRYDREFNGQIKAAIAEALGGVEHHATDQPS